MSATRLQSLKTKAKLLQKSKAKAGKPILLKTALDIIAKTSGFDTWRDLKENIEANEVLWTSLGGAFWNNWYASYEDALAVLTDDQFLLPFQKQFFICDINYVNSLGLIKDDKDLMDVGNNWVTPKDADAWRRLLKKLRLKK